jgi:chromosome segregation ATPase
MLMDRLQELEGKVREAVATLQETRAQKVALEARLQELEGRMESLSDTVRKEQREKEHLKTSLQRLEAEREEVRSRVDALLEEVARAEGTLKERH